MNDNSTRDEILDSDYNKDKNLIKLKVKNLDEDKVFSWAFSGEDFDNLINQFTGKSFSYSPEQRDTLLNSIIGKKFTNIVNIEVKDVGPENIKEKAQEVSDILDQYPYWEIINSINEAESKD